MPPMRMKEHARAKKGTLKRLIKEFVTRYPGQLLLSTITGDTLPKTFNFTTFSYFLNI